MFRTVIVTILAVLVTLLMFDSDNQQDDINGLRAKNQAIVACISNTAYSRDLFGQCLDDYRDSHK